MAEVQLAIRLMCAEASVESQLVRTGRISQEMMGRIINNMDKLNEAKLFIDDTPSISIMELTAKARRLKQEHNIGMVVVDYLQLVNPVRDGKSNREQEIRTDFKVTQGACQGAEHSRYRSRPAQPIGGAALRRPAAAAFRPQGVGLD